ncbi:MAG TPA: hypothetical protein VKV95_19365 [Terriglobia bacterium]|nr:hypothetical protein [Terriglobia bacterium]
MEQTRKKKSFGRKVFEAALIVPFLLIVMPLIVVGLGLHLLNKILIYFLIWLWWLPKGMDVLFVSSESPIWKGYMENQILPLVAGRAIVLIWSKRHEWSRFTFKVRVFRAFGRDRDFNPMVLLFKPLRLAKVFRFLPAFKDWKHGHPETLERLRHDLTLAL